MTKDYRTCIDCKHFRFDAGSRGYSEFTPGWAWEAECERGHFVDYEA